MPIIIKGNTISNSKTGISVPPDIDAIIDDNLFEGVGTAIEVRDFRNLVTNTFSKIEVSSLSLSEKQRVASSLKNLIQSLPKPSMELIRDAALSVELLVNTPEAYKNATALIHFITNHMGR